MQLVTKTGVIYIGCGNPINQRRIKMKLNAPKNVTFWVAVVIALLGFLGTIVKIPIVSPNAYWFTFIGFVILALGNMVKGL